MVKKFRSMAILLIAGALLVGCGELFDPFDPWGGGGSGGGGNGGGGRDSSGCGKDTIFVPDDPWDDPWDDPVDTTDFPDDPWDHDSTGGDPTDTLFWGGRG